MLSIGRIFFRHVMALFGVVGLCLFTLSAFAQFDIAGVSLGMTKEEAMAALKSHDNSLELAEYEGHAIYSDQVHSFKTPKFLTKIMASGKNGTILVHFSGPPEKPKVVVIYRESLMQAPPSHAQFVDSLKKKYGEPSVWHKSSNGAFIWDEPGKPQCNRPKDKSPHHNPLVIPSHMIVGGTEQYLHDVGRVGHSMFFFEKDLPSDLAQCGSYVIYSSSSDPVSRFEAYAVDVSSIVSSERQTRTWVDGFTKEAIKKRLSQGQTPRL